MIEASKISNFEILQGFKSTAIAKAKWTAKVCIDFNPR